MVRLKLAVQIAALVLCLVYMAVGVKVYFIADRLPLAILHSDMVKLGTMEDSLTASSVKQVAELDLIDTRIKKELGDIHDVTIHTDCSLNGCPGRGIGLLPQMTETVKGINDFTLKAGNSLDTTTGNASDFLLSSGNAVRMVSLSAQEAVDKTVPLLDGLTNDVADMRPILASGQSIAKHADKITEHLEDIADKVQGAVDKAYAPKNKFLRAMDAFFHGAISVSELIFYLTH